MVWIDLPNVHRSLAKRRATAALKEVAVWMTTALGAEVPAYLVGLRGKAWLEESIAALASTRQYHEADFAMCR